MRERSDGTTSCTLSLAGCGSSAIGGGDVSAAMADPDVQAAFAGSVALYGSDPRGCDGTVLDVTLAGKTIEIGGDCSRAGSCGGTTACTPVPKGLAALADLLEKLDEQELAQPACAGAR